MILTLLFEINLSLIECWFFLKEMLITKLTNFVLLKKELSKRKTIHYTFCNVSFVGWELVFIMYPLNSYFFWQTLNTHTHSYLPNFIPKTNKQGNDFPLPHSLFHLLLPSSPLGFHYNFPSFTSILNHRFLHTNLFALNSFRFFNW